MAFALKVDAFPACLGRNQKATLLLETLDGLTSLSMLHGAIDELDLVAAIVVSQCFAQVVLSGAVFGKDQHLLVGIGGVDLADDVFDKQLQFEVVRLQGSCFGNQVFKQLHFTSEEFAGITSELFFPLTQVTLVSGLFI
ncbi:hypothetical protein D3C84_969010 [compost metagenome]